MGWVEITPTDVEQYTNGAAFIVHERRPGFCSKVTTIELSVLDVLPSLARQVRFDDSARVRVCGSSNMIEVSMLIVLSA